MSFFAAKVYGSKTEAMPTGRTVFLYDSKKGLMSQRNLPPYEVPAGKDHHWFWLQVTKAAPDCSFYWSRLLDRDLTAVRADMRRHRELIGRLCDEITKHRDTEFLRHHARDLEDACDCLHDLVHQK